ncbi:unnamed protein product, partial [Hapterophycus canaliculatus]
HRRQQGLFKIAHPSPREKGGRPLCNVPPGEYRLESDRTGKTRGGVKSWEVCLCHKCEAVG